MLTTRISLISRTYRVFAASPYQLSSTRSRLYHSPLHRHPLNHHRILRVRLTSKFLTPRRIIGWAVKSLIVVSAFRYLFKLNVEITDYDEDDDGNGIDDDNNDKMYDDDDDDDDGNTAENKSDDPADHVSINQALVNGTNHDTQLTYSTNYTNIITIESGFFLPVGRTYELPRTFYQATDPEWQEFVKLSRDKDRLDSLRKKLVLFVRKRIIRHPKLAYLGDADLTCGKYWLDIIFPEGPPLQYEQSGFLITPEYIAWASRILSHEKFHQQQRLVWPREMIWAFFTTFNSILTTNVFRFFGISRQSASLPRSNNSIDTSGPSSSQIPDTVTTTHIPNINSPSNLATSASTSSVYSSPLDSNNDDNILSLSKWSTNSPSNASNPLDTLRKAYTMSRSFISTEPPRGSVIVLGLVELTASAGRATLDVTSFYDPVTNEFSHVYVAVKSIRPSRQRPRGYA